MNSMNVTTLGILAGCGLDLLLGDPHWLYHPVRLIGKLISGLEKDLRNLFPRTKGGERAGGILLAILTVSLTAASVRIILWAGEKGGSVSHFFLVALLSYFLLAARSLRDESMKVYWELRKGNLQGARRAVSMIVGRDTQDLTTEGVTKAAVETVAENTSDGVIAPLFYLAIGGPVLGWAYKAVNTMDSMVGYRNDRYRWFGTASAVLDDILNFIPARISGILMTICAGICGFDRKNAWRIFLRDRYNHASPNSAQTESAMAGALNLQLAGDAYYFGKLVKKKTIGDPDRAIEPEDIRRANRLMLSASAVAAGIFLCARVLLCDLY